MHAAAFRVLRTAQGPISRRACRVVAGVRRPLPQRTFQTTAYLQRTPKDTEVDESDGTAEKPNSVPENVSAEEPAITNPSPVPDEVENVQVPQRVRLGRPPGRSTANRHKQPDGLPPVVLPDWFWDNNVKCLEDPVNLAGTLAVYGNSVTSLDKSAEQVDGNSVEAEENVTDPATLTTDAKGTSQPTIGQPDWSMAARSMAASQEKDIVKCGLKPTAEAKYSVHVHVYKEILAVIRSGLTLRPPPKVHSKDLRRPILLLQCPKDGGTYYLDSIVETIATKLEADLVRLDSEDIAQLVGNYAEENLAWAQSSTALLSYETSKVAGKLEQFGYKHEQDDLEDLEEEEKSGAGISDIGSWRPSPKHVSPRLEEVKKRLLEVFPRVPTIFDSFAKSPSKMDLGKGVSIFEISGRAEPATGNGKAGPDQWNELKVQTLLDALISGADSKRLSTSGAASKSKSTPRDLIIQIRDFKEMGETQQGASLISKMRDIVNKRWLDGRNIILVGTTSMEASLSATEIKELEAGDFEHESKTIYVPPDRREEQDVAFEVDEKRRILNLNVRHIEDMITKLAGGNQDSLVVDIMKDLDNSIIYSADLEDVVWTFARVHRVATTVMGLNKSTFLIDGPVFTEALSLLAGSDTVKYNWGHAEARKEDKELDSALDELNSASDPLKKVTTKDRMKQLKKTCTAHEKKLLGGVINPSDIHTTFDQVHAPKETIEALKMLTTLSLLRPEAFSYGVLATDKIPGLLLYGPPGTGKTLLAKAVAKESGATVLEISGAEVNDMYVGEGEKNVKAIFSLAKKLSPCIVFIDEADAIFAARGGGSSRHQTHRELINQFLREWDGMNDLSAFIMVATNRPFDLDEAVLRRLPRRLLVDLPVEKDREAILKIHLKDEILDESVSLSKLAKDTPFYSGSDLKNISVAAALACIREENEIAAKHTGEEPYVYPAKRTLMKKHFDKAMEEISASISEDMSTLSAIRKFDEKYGDRKGRRKKNSSLGFGGTNVPEKDSEAGRVRKVAE